MMIGIEAPAAVAGTYPVSTRPSAIEPTRKVGTPITAGLPTGTASTGSGGGAAGALVPWLVWIAVMESPWV